MKLFAVAFGLLFGGAMFASTVSAAIVVSVQTPGAPFSTNSGIQSINVFARGNGGVDSGIVLTADFSLGAGASFATPNAGTFGGPGFIGNGNINFAGSSFLRDPGNPRFGNLSIEYNLSQNFLLTNGLLATLDINTAGLAPGTYAINFLGADLDGNAGTGTGGSFQISAVAVPEPGSAALLAVIGVGGAWVRKRRLAKKAAVVAA